MTPEELKIIMEENCLNAKKLADLLHVSQGAIYHWRNGTRPISKLMCDYLMLKLGRGRTMAVVGKNWTVYDDL